MDPIYLFSIKLPKQKWDNWSTLIYGPCTSNCYYLIVNLIMHLKWRLFESSFSSMHMHYKSFRWIPMIIESIIIKWQMSYNKGEVFFESRDKIILLRLSNNRQLSWIQAFDVINYGDTLRYWMYVRGHSLTMLGR